MFKLMSMKGILQGSSSSVVLISASSLGPLALAWETSYFCFKSATYSSQLLLVHS